jgi:phosphatidylserine decarboxylase
VHVNRAPIAGRVISIERGGVSYLAAFNRRAESENVRCTLTLETARGEKVRVVQITGLIARRIVCHPRVGDWVRRGDRYGLIRFGSRTDVVLPVSAELRVRRGESVRGGSSLIAQLPGAA